MGKKTRRRKLGTPSAESIAARLSGKVVTITRERALLGLLDTAIDLWLFDRDICAIHVLSFAAWKTLRDIGSKTGRGPLLEKHFSDLQHLLMGYDFFRHASPNLRVVLDLPPIVNEFIIWDAVHSFEKIFSRQSAVMKTFAAWFAVSNRSELNLLHQNAHVFLPSGILVEQVCNLDRKQFFERVLSAFLGTKF